MNTIKEIKEKTLKGQHDGVNGAVFLHLTKYRKNPRRELVRFASTLYSARLAMNIDQWFAPLVPRLVKRVSYSFDNKNAEELDVISTVLSWWGKRKDIRDWTIVKTAVEAADLGIEAAEHEEDGGHSYSLLCTTADDLLVFGGWFRAFFYLDYLKSAAQRADAIRNPDQKARVYRRLARGCLVRLRFVRGALYLQKARSVPNISPDVQDKNRIIR